MRKTEKKGMMGIGRARQAEKIRVGRAMLDAVGHSLLLPSWLSYDLTAHTISVSIPAPSVHPSRLDFTVSRLILALVSSPTTLFSR